LIRQEVALLDHTLLQKHRLHMDLQQSLPAVQGEASALGSALMNLCINAVDAMPAGGTITLRTRLAGDLVQVEVMDTGEGMAPEVLKKAMEPFFTTKAAGMGTGLGLAMVLNAVRAHGGTCTLQSEVGKGTRALLQFPAAATQPEPAASSQPLPAALAPRHILFVDDDELLRATVPFMIEMLGHRVESVDSGVAALAWLESRGCPDFIVLDMNMPGLDGLETLRRIRDLSATVPVLLATGYLEARVEAAIAKDPRVLTLKKPFTLDEIQQKLAALDQLQG
jgi:CheY-like chemotaxis protein